MPATLRKLADEVVKRLTTNSRVPMIRMMGMALQTDLSGILARRRMKRKLLNGFKRQQIKVMEHPNFSSERCMQRERV